MDFYTSLPGNQQMVQSYPVGRITAAINGGGSSTGGGVTLETPSGTIDASNTIFTVAHTPKFICVDGGLKFETLHYTYLAGTITITDGVAPSGYIISFY